MRRYTFILDQLWEVDYGIVDNEPVEILSKAVGKEMYFTKDPSVIFPGGESYLEETYGKIRIIAPK